MKAKYLGENGYPFEREEANKHFEVGKEYEVVGGRCGRERSSLRFAGIDKSFNSVMFDFGKDVEALLDSAYRSEYLDHTSPY